MGIEKRKTDVSGYLPIQRRYHWHLWLYLAVISTLFVALFFAALRATIGAWSSEEYSHGYILPIVAGFFIWRERVLLERLPIAGSWAGFGLVLLSLALFFAGELGTLYIVQQYALVVSVLGFALALLGWPRFRSVAPALFLLIFAIPLPIFLYNNLSQSLQLLSSEIGVAVIRLFSIPVFLEGNVIDLGEMKLQVVEACSGLRYLFPLMALGYIAAYLFKGAFWKKALLFLSTIPITVLMNSFRIGIIGVTSAYWGQGAAEGFLHDFEGWIIFMACSVILVVEMWILARVGKHKMPLSEAFGLDFPAPRPKDDEVVYEPVPKPLIASVVALVLALIGAQFIEHREEVVPDARPLAEFPVEFGGWQGQSDQLEQIYIDALKFDDYMIGNYVDGRRQPVNLYIAYYGSQRKGASVHSPRSCMPGGGWEIQSLTQRTIEGASVAGNPVVVNRTVIQMGEAKQLVYYWFQQRGRAMTNEYLVKWYLFWDAITKNRTDGSLVRLTVAIPPRGDVAEADKVLEDFAREVAPLLGEFVPE